jgi:TIR domain
MLVVLSWSGEKSRLVARALERTLPLSLQHVTPWVSERDIGAGETWFNELMKNLSRCRIGVVCMTPDNIASPWIHFEAGVIAATGEEQAGKAPKRVLPFLVGIDDSELPGALSMYQATDARDRASVKSFLATLNNHLETSKQCPSIDRVFPEFWKLLQRHLDSKPAVTKKRPPAGPRTTRKELDALHTEINKRREALKSRLRRG